MKTLQTWVANFGGGFLMLGGEESFGAGGYFRTPVANLLPLSIESEEREETPVVALLVILDRSGSMSASAGNSRRSLSPTKDRSLPWTFCSRRTSLGFSPWTLECRKLCLSTRSR